MSMFVVCYAVYSKSSNKLISEWQITQLGHQSTTFREFYQGPVAGMLGIHKQENLQVNSNTAQILAAYVGANKNDANPVQSLDIRMFDVMTVFGRYVKFIVE